jgi:hypothetical protein
LGRFSLQEGLGIAAVVGNQSSEATNFLAHAFELFKQNNRLRQWRNVCDPTIVDKDESSFAICSCSIIPIQTASTVMRAAPQDGLV